MVLVRQCEAIVGAADDTPFRIGSTEGQAHQGFRARSARCATRLVGVIEGGAVRNPFFSGDRVVATGRVSSI